VLGRAEAGIMAGVGTALIAITAIGILWPMVLAAPIVLLGGWIGIALIVRALDLYTKPRDEDRPPDPSEPPDDCDARR
jgi:hypothetical protein